MSIIKKPIFISSCIFLSWILIEIIIDNFSKKRIKHQTLKFISEYKINKYKKYYKVKFKNVKNQIKRIKDLEKSHLVSSLNKTFNDKFLNLKQLINKLNFFRTKKNTYSEQIISTENILWYPYLFRIFFTVLNNTNILFWKWKYTFRYYSYNSTIIYLIRPNNNKFCKTIIIFTGLGGVLNNFERILNLLIKNNYQIIIPLYGPSQASLSYNIESHEAEFQSNLYDFLIDFNIKQIEILCWSLGGVLYKGFEKYIKIKNSIRINKVFLFEPLLTLRACIDTYLLQVRNYSITLDILNSVTLDKYYNYNKIFSYFMHTVIGFSTSNSFGCFSSNEFILTDNSSEKYQYPRYLFVSSDDLILNNELDHDFIKYNFDKENVYFRKGYHGGWLNSSQIPIKLEPLLK